MYNSKVETNCDFIIRLNSCTNDYNFPFQQDESLDLINNNIIN